MPRSMHRESGAVLTEEFGAGYELRTGDRNPDGDSSTGTARGDWLMLAAHTLLRRLWTLGRGPLVLTVLLAGCAGAVFALQPFGQRGWASATILALLAATAIRRSPARRLSGTTRGVAIVVLSGWLGLIAWSSANPSWPGLADRPAPDRRCQAWKDISFGPLRSAGRYHARARSCPLSEPLPARLGEEPPGGRVFNANRRKRCGVSSMHSPNPAPPRSWPTRTFALGSRLKFQ